MRNCPSARYGPALSGTDKQNLYHKSSFNSYHFQSDLPRLPIPTVENTLNRYLDSMNAQSSSLTTAQLEEAQKLAMSERKEIDNLHELLLDFDKANLDTNYSSIGTKF